MIKKILTSLLFASFIAPSFAYTGVNEFIVRKNRNINIHLIDYLNVLVVLEVYTGPFEKNVACGVFPLDQNTRVAKFGKNTVSFANKEFGNLNGKNYFYLDEKTHVTMYRKQCNNFKPQEETKG